MRLKILSHLFKYILVPSLFHIGGGYSRPCYPTDPTGNNPQNPCLVYPPPGINSNTFIQGDALPIRAIPTVGQPQGKILENPSGFWTGVKTENGSRVITTNNGEVFRLPASP